MEELYSFLIYIVVMTSVAVLFVVLLVIMLQLKVTRIMTKLDELAGDIRGFMEHDSEEFETKTASDQTDA